VAYFFATVPPAVPPVVELVAPAPVPPVVVVAPPVVVVASVLVAPAPAPVYVAPPVLVEVEVVAPLWANPFWIFCYMPREHSQNAYVPMSNIDHSHPTNDFNPESRLIKNTSSR
jgi:hypothetical protein